VPIPNNEHVAGDPYSMKLLVRMVGLPQRGENRSPAQLRTLWNQQSLTDLRTPARSRRCPARVGSVVMHKARGLATDPSCQTSRRHGRQPRSPRTSDQIGRRTYLVR
jgi:hypothetical protein